MRTRIWPACVVALVAAVVLPLELSAQSTRGAADARQAGEFDLAREVERIRAATAAYRDVGAAVAAGYAAPVPDHCMESGAGVMGHHHINQQLLDDRLEVERPEVMVYEPTADGGRKLVGVEYIVPYSARGRDETPPRILGQQLKRADGLGIWYLHVWVWEENPNGLFADWHPTLTCSPAQDDVGDVGSAGDRGQHDSHSQQPWTGAPRSQQATFPTYAGGQA